MRKRGQWNLITSFSLIMCMALSLVMASPNVARAEDTAPTEQTEPTAVTLNLTTKDISPGEVFQLIPTLTPATATTTYTWNSSLPSNASVDSNGIVTGLAIGSTDITVTTANGKTASCHVNVRIRSYTQVIFEENEVKVQPGEVQKIEGEVYPTDAIYTELFWESTNTEIATVERDSSKHRKAYISGEKVGKCYIIVRNKDGQEIGSIRVRVGSPSGLEKMKSVKASKVTITELKRGKGTFKVKYKKVTDASGYQIKYKKSGKWIVIDTTKKSFTVNKLQKGTYKVKVRAYRKYEGKKYYGHYSKTQKIKVK